MWGQQAGDSFFMNLNPDNNSIVAQRCAAVHFGAAGVGRGHLWEVVPIRNKYWQPMPGN
jgi:hypothetical protein